MRKKLEAELISIAHRILQLKHKDDVRELHHEAQKLYEKLSVLLFVEENLGEIKPTIGLQEMEEKLEHAFDFDDKVVVAQLKEEELDEIIETKSKAKAKKIDPKIEAPQETEEPEQTAHEEETILVEEKTEKTVEEEIKEEITTEKLPETKLISIDDLLNHVAPDPVFERLVEKNEEQIHEDANKIIEKKIIESIKEETPLVVENITAGFIPEFKEITFEKIEDKTGTNLNDKISKSAGLTLNDRVAFEKNLFDGSTADLNRVISQVATFDTYEDAKNFIEEMVKPDYNDWIGKDEFASRFMEFVQSKFV